MRTNQGISVRRSYASGTIAATESGGELGLDRERSTSLNMCTNIIGPRPGYSPQLGVLVSMLTWIRSALVERVEGMTRADLDYLFDSGANSIGALLLHLAATETYYQINTFEATNSNGWSDDMQRKWNPAMMLGDAGRNVIKGHDLDYYLNVLHETRENSLTGFRKRDDDWLMAVDQAWFWGPTNNYCKWFHVCEHESHHAGQIEIARRLRGS